MTFLSNYSNAAGLTEQQPEKAGTAANKQDMRAVQVPHFTGFHTNF